MQAVADGGLTRRLDTETDSEAMAEIAASFNEMLDSLVETAKGAKGFADTVRSVSNQASTSGVAIQRASTEVADSVDSIATDAAHWQSELRSTQKEMSGLLATIEEIASSGPASPKRPTRPPRRAGRVGRPPPKQSGKSGRFRPRPTRPRAKSTP